MKETPWPQSLIYLLSGFLQKNLGSDLDPCGLIYSKLAHTDPCTHEYAHTHKHKNLASVMSIYEYRHECRNPDWCECILRYH